MYHIVNKKGQYLAHRKGTCIRFSSRVAMAFTSKFEANLFIKDTLEELDLWIKGIKDISYKYGSELFLNSLKTYNTNKNKLKDLSVKEG